MGILEAIRAKRPALAKTLADAPSASKEVRREDFLGKMTVGPSEDLTRILSLPRRPPLDQEAQAACAREMTALLRRDNPNCACARLKRPCITDLLPIQGWYLSEARTAGGALGALTVGSGKTGLDILTAMVVPGCKTAVLLIPPGLRGQFRKDYEVWSQHFRVPNLAGGSTFVGDGRPVLEMLAYTQLQTPGFSTWLKSRKPDVIIADECQALKDRRSVRGSRFLRYFVDASDTKFFCHSASLTTRGLEDYAHLSALALGDSSPVPLLPITVAEWAQALDPKPRGGRALPGALRAFAQPKESARVGHGRRVAETFGVIGTTDASIPTRITVSLRNPGKVPESVLQALRDTKQEKTRPDGEQLLTALEVANCASEIAYGFYYFWKFPRGEPEELILKWFAKRKAWGSALRARMEYRSDDMDSPELLANAAERAATGYKGKLHTWDCPDWAPWRDIKGQVYHEQDVCWIDDFLARDAAKWAREKVGIVWFSNVAFGRRVAKLSGCPYYGAGKEAAAAIEAEDGTRSVIASLDAHHAGRNLQAFSRCLFSNQPVDGAIVEQAIGRMHRYGQTADVVEVEIYQHVGEAVAALASALDYARYMSETLRNPQKLLMADWLGHGLAHLNPRIIDN